ncbi:hypothetical protein GCM10011418_43180 [Sphingobacterium alkalisoli]|nr:hypothetical protein GCM10011418_43180 [Sphingobacterium alkalisoli]
MAIDQHEVDENIPGDGNNGNGNKDLGPSPSKPSMRQAVCDSDYSENKTGYGKTKTENSHQIHDKLQVKS